MKSLRELFRIGKGPSSSHTMGPDNAARIYAKRHPEAKSFEVTLYGSLAATGKGHMTDVAIIDVLSKIAPVNIVWQPKIFLPFHPNGPGSDRDRICGHMGGRDCGKRNGHHQGGFVWYL